MVGPAGLVWAEGENKVANSADFLLLLVTQTTRHLFLSNKHETIGLTKCVGEVKMNLNKTILFSPKDFTPLEINIIPVKNVPTHLKKQKKQKKTSKF